MPNYKPYVGISGGGWLALIALSIAALASSNPWLTLFCFWAVPVFVVLLWRRFEPPILLFAVMVQWAEVCAKVIHADLLDVPISEFFADSVIVESILRGLIGLIVILLVIGFMLPSKVHVEQTVVIDAPIDRVYSQVYDLRNWEKWSPYKKMDPLMELSYSNPAFGQGAFYVWDSEVPELGKGKLTIAEAIANHFAEIFDGLLATDRNQS